MFVNSTLFKWASLTREVSQVAPGVHYKVKLLLACELQIRVRGRAHAPNGGDACVADCRRLRRKNGDRQTLAEIYNGSKPA